MFSIHLYSSFPYNSFSKFDHIDTYKVYATCIPTDIESRLLRRPYSHFSCKPSVYLPPLHNTNHNPFRISLHPCFLSNFFYFHYLSWYNKWERLWHAMANSTACICCVKHQPISFWVFKVTSVDCCVHRTQSHALPFVCLCCLFDTVIA